MPADKPLCIGHIGYDRVELVSGKLFVLDTGAANGGQLTALILPGFELVEIKSPINYHWCRVKDFQYAYNLL